MLMLEKFASPIWDDSGEPDSWRIFRAAFDWSGNEDAETVLELCVESTFEVWLNGRRVSGQQLSDFSDERTASVLPVSDFLRPGKNELEITVHWIGLPFSTCLCRAPFLLALLRQKEKLLLVTNETWQVSEAPMHCSGLQTRVTPQLGLVFEYDARQREFRNWRMVRVLKREEVCPRVTERRVPQLAELPLIPGKTVQKGTLKRECEKETFARSCMADRLLPEASPDANGSYLILDLGRECAGYLALKLVAPEGCIVDIAYGEHLADGRVRAAIGPRNFADRYHCCSGENDFVFPHRRIGCRYLELHFTHCPEGGKVHLEYAGLLPLELPLPEPANFEFHGERQLETLHRLSRRTLKLCMHEHYEDTPWREQSLYAYDSRNQMLFGYYLWGNWTFAANSLNLLGKSFDGERYLGLTAPARSKRTIPIFTMVWITALYEHWLFSGSGTLFEQWQEVIRRILERALSEVIPGCPGLYSPGHGEKIWNFCEWAGDLGSLESEPQSPYNFYLAEALRSASEMFRLSGDGSLARKYAGAATALGDALKKYFYDPENGFFTAAAGKREYYEHLQMLALLFAPLSETERIVLLNNLTVQETVPLSLAALPYYLRAMMGGTPDSRRQVEARLLKIFEPMLSAGATSLWETALGSEDFHQAGSLCHAWSAVFPYWLGGFLLGIRPLTPGFSEFEVRPYGVGRSGFSGSVPTPHGAIRLSWEHDGNGIAVKLKHPAGTRPVLRMYAECPITRLDAEQ